MSVETYTNLPYEPIAQPAPRVAARRPYPGKYPKRKKKEKGEMVREKPAPCKGWEELPAKLLPHITPADKQEWFRATDPKVRCKSCTSPSIKHTHMCAYHTVYHRLFGRMRRGIIPSATICKGCGITFTPTKGHQKYCVKSCQKRAGRDVYLYKTKLARGEAGYQERNAIMKDNHFTCVRCKVQRFGELTPNGAVAVPRFREISESLAKAYKGDLLVPLCEPCSLAVSGLLTLRQSWGWEDIHRWADNTLPLKTKAD